MRLYPKQDVSGPNQFGLNHGEPHELCQGHTYVSPPTRDQQQHAIPPRSASFHSTTLWSNRKQKEIDRCVGHKIH